MSHVSPADYPTFVTHLECAFTGERFEPVKPVSGARFSGVPNSIATPHIAGITKESNARVGKMTAYSIGRLLLAELAE
ncbi:MAG: hypothetical protein ACNYZH_05705 [Acidimicrobiia bacterium]